MKRTILAALITCAAVALPMISHADPEIPVVPEPSTFYAGASLLVPIGFMAARTYLKNRRQK